MLTQTDVRNKNMHKMLILPSSNTKHWEGGTCTVVFSDTHPETGNAKCQCCFSFCYLWMTSDTFWRFCTSWAIFRHVCVIFEKTWHYQDKNSMPTCITCKKLAGICFLARHSNLLITVLHGGVPSHPGDQRGSSKNKCQQCGSYTQSFNREPVTH